MSSLPHDANMILRLGHSPDPDDAFMWWPLFELNGRPPRIDSSPFRFVPVMADIEVLNHRALDASALEITAISCAQYPHVKNRYALTACGASMGDHYGPKLVSRQLIGLDDVSRDDIVIAIPGERTSAYTTMRLMLGDRPFQYAVVPFDQIIARVAGGEYAAGLIIHEGQLTYGEAGLRLIADLGEWWSRTHDLPLPLGVNVIRRDLESVYGEGTLTRITALLLRSVEYAMAHREESVQYALGFARDMGAAMADQFITMYVNKWTVDFGPQGRRAVRHFLTEAFVAGLGPDPGEIDFVQPATVASMER